MKRNTIASGLAALAMLVLLTPSFATVADNSLNMGDFLAAYAKAIRLDLPANAGTDTVVAALKASGVKLDAIDASRTLTQGDVVRFGKANGLRISSSNPAAAFSAAEMDQFFATFGATITQSGDRVAASDNPPGDPANNANTTKGKKKGRPFQSPTEPE